MSYAKYGIDVHEKTVTNQLAHQGCATLLTGNVFAFTSYLTRLIFGPLRKLKVQGSFEFLKELGCYIIVSVRLLSFYFGRSKLVRF